MGKKKKNPRLRLIILLGLVNWGFPFLVTFMQFLSNQTENYMFALFFFFFLSSFLFLHPSKVLRSAPDKSFDEDDFSVGMMIFPLFLYRQSVWWIYRLSTFPNFYIRIFIHYCIWLWTDVLFPFVSGVLIIAYVESLKIQLLCKRALLYFWFDFRSNLLL